MPADRPRLCRVAGRDTWHIYHQRRRISTGCTDRPSAEIVLARFSAELGRPQPGETVTLSGILDRYLDNRRDAAIPGLARLEWAHKPLARHFAQRPPEVVTDDECRSYRARRKREGVADGTIRTELQALRAALNWAHGKNLLAVKPNVLLPPRPEPRPRWLTKDEADRLLIACKAPHVRLFVAIGLNTGARPGAITGLTWDRVDLTGRRINFRDPALAKTRKRRVPVPINDTLLAELLIAQAGATTEHVVEWAGGPVARVKHAFHDAAVRAGLLNVTPHTLRHTAVTRMLHANVPLWQVASYVGMTVEMVQEVYGHPASDFMGEAARALG